MANPTLLEKVSVISNAIRTLLLTALAVGLASGGWYLYHVHNASEIEAQRANAKLTTALEDLEFAQADLVSKGAIIEGKEREIGSLNVLVEEQDKQIGQHKDEIKRQALEIKQQAAEIERLDTAMHLLKVDHRVAYVSVVEQKSTDGQVTTTVEFQEMKPNGDPIGESREFTIIGDVIYIDSWVVKFDDRYVESADIHRATSLVVFRRIFGELQQPREGFALDEEGARPIAYGRGTEPSELEDKIWADFWNVANDEAKQAVLGIRAVHGEAPSIKLQKGKTYRVDLRASGGLSISAERNVE